MADRSLFDKIKPADFEKTRENLNNILKTMEGDPQLQQSLCSAMAKHYRHLAQIDGMRDEALEEADYFSQAEIGYKMRHKVQTS